MFSELDKYIYLFSKAFDVNGNHVKLNEEIQLTAYKHLKGLWLLDGVFNCLDLIFGGTRDLDGLFFEYFHSFWLIFQVLPGVFNA